MRPLLKQLGLRISFALATGFGVGHFPVMPGTVGSLWGLPLVWLLQRSFPVGGVLASISAVVIFLVGVPICQHAQAVLGRSDPPQVVFDEIAAFPFVFLFVPLTLPSAVCGFCWFRLFDIVKPWPIRQIERLPGGLGIMADDLLAAIFAAAALMLTMPILEQL